MANNLTGLNFSTRTGEGGADVMTWGNLDRSANRLYAEQKQAELTAAKSFQDADNILKKELGGIRSADEKEIFDLYKEATDARKELLFNPNIQKDVRLYAEKQRNATLKEAALRERINKSKETKKNLELVSKFDLDDFDPERVKDYPTYLNAPTSELEKIGATVPQYFMNQGIDLGKLGQWKKSAAGYVKDVPFGTPKEVNDGYEIEQSMIMRGNDPVQYFNALASNFASKEAAYTARALAKQMTPQQKTQIQTRFNQIPEEEFKSKWGISKQDLLNKRGSADDYANEYLVLDAMEFAVDNLPKEATPKRTPNKKFIDEVKKKEYDRRFKLQEGGKNFRAAIMAKGGNNQLDPAIAVNEIYDLGNETGLGYRIKKGGQPVFGREVTLTPELEEDFFDKYKGNKERPTHTVMSHDKQKLYLIYTEADGTTVDEDKTRVVNVPTDLVSSIAKNYGGSVFTRKNLFTGNRQTSSSNKPATTKKPQGRKDPNL